jgi:AraC family transcriptional regulator
MYQIARAVALIESRLFEAIALPELASHVGCSQWHFHRTFTAITGQTPAMYMRKRRFGEFCRLLVETERPLIQIALDGGFESQAAFTRAFTRHVGISPGRYRRAGVLDVANCYPPLDVAALASFDRRTDMEPRLVQRPAFWVVGISTQCFPSHDNRLAELWERFNARSSEIEHCRAGAAYGVCCGEPALTDEEGCFVYTAALEVERIDRPPTGMVALTIPANTYAVFMHKGDVRDIGKTIREIYGAWLPAAKLRQASAPDFELYDARFDGQTGTGEVDIYVPVEVDWQLVPSSRDVGRSRAARAECRRLSIADAVGPGRRVRDGGEDDGGHVDGGRARQPRAPHSQSPGTRVRDAGQVAKEHVPCSHCERDFKPRACAFFPWV